MKTCHACGLERPASAFYRDRSKPDGRDRVCSDCKRGRVQAWRRANPARHLASVKGWAKRNPRLRLEQLRRTRYRVKAAVVAAYGGACTCCGETASEFLTIDHPNGGGAEHRRAIGKPGGYRFYLWLKQHGFPREYRLLCFNCNAARGFYGYCPHERGAAVGAEA